jgi:hypothetical protein
MKIVVNKCFGGFSLSQEATEYLASLGHTGAIRFIKHREEVENTSWRWWAFRDTDRDNRLLVQTVEKLGSEKASGPHADLGIIEIPDGIDWVIDEYDGMEHIEEAHRSWY